MVLLNNFLDIIESLPAEQHFSLPVLKQNSLKIEFDNDDNVTTVYNGSPPLLPFAESDVFYASISKSRRLTSLEGDCKAVYEVTFDVKGSNLNFKAGDTIGVIPHNDESDVNFIISHLDLTLKADHCYTLSVDASVKGSKIPAHVPVKSTLRYILTNCLDLRSVLKKLFLLALSKHTKEEKERKILEYLCSKEGSLAYTAHILDKGLCVLDIFTIFKSCKPPIEVILANLPRLLPRPYSIVNSGLKNNVTMTICFSVMTVNNRKGLTTGWLENKILNELNLEHQLQNLSLTKEENNDFLVPIYLRKNMSMFSLPEDLQTPLILIGPGTGVAPFIGFLEEREYVKENKPDTKLGEAWLFFGCRNPELDFIYEKELKDFLSKEILNKLSTAFSRIDDNKQYVQDVLSHNAVELVQLINDGATVYICGDLNTMAAQVKDVFVKAFVEQDNMTVEEAGKKIAELQKNKRYFVDAWS
ncbi:methionine synthase reductase-like [Anticarsia gemmatalis]|uniref:methionine synthase reductase-like n=1 Tax=Anticarsia gemmatalis TaxID=129554 RepID=UPI003F777B2A